MTEYNKYPEYKNSGVDDVEEIPVAWQASPLKKALLRNDGGAWGDDYKGQREVIVMRSTEQTKDGEWKIYNPARRFLSEKEYESTKLELNDLLITKSSGSSSHIGKTTIVDDSVASIGAGYSNFMQRLRMNSKSDAKFIWHQFQSHFIRNQIKLKTQSTIGLGNLNAKVISNLVFILPPLYVQKQIAAFLDSETKKIDDSVSAMESLISLLTEKRTALISETVTRGIPGEHTEFKDSGVEWLGEIPANWDIAKIKHFAHLVKRPAVEGQENITAFRNGRVTLRRNVRSSGYTEADKEHGYQSIHVGDLVIHNMDAFAGAIGVSDSYGKSTPVYTACEVNDKGDAMFLAYSLRVMAWNDWILALSRGIRERSTDFRWPTSSNQYIAAPEKEEQERIVSYIESESAKIDTLIDEAQKSIALLKEKRQTLISDAVTGKIDVSNIVN